MRDLNEGVGIDLVEFDTFQDAERNPRFLKKVFTAAEIQYCRKKRDPLPSLAARFAAKEAVIKAVGSLGRSVFYSDIEILKRANGSIAAVLTNCPGIRVAVNISHGRRSAVAVAMAKRSNRRQP